MDPLSDVFSLLKVKSVLSARFEAAGPWALRFPAYRHVKFGGVIKGARWVWIEGVSAPVKMEEGDFCLLTDGSPYCFASDPAVKMQDGEAMFSSHLERFKDLVGLPPLEYLIRWRMTIARDALKTGNDNLASIAAAVGYASETTFSSTFKKMFGQSPSRYRAQVRGKV